MELRDFALRARSVYMQERKRVQFSGPSPSYPGVWQINVYVPQSVAPSSAAGPTAVDIIYNNSPAWSANSPWRTYIYVK
jgi:hypothetical protein